MGEFTLICATELGQSFLELRRGLKGMDFTAEVSDLFGAVGSRLGGGSSLLVPVKGGSGGREKGNFVKKVIHERTLSYGRGFVSGGVFFRKLFS